jgi:hypothetical protein
MTKPDIEFEHSSGNVFADLGKFFSGNHPRSPPRPYFQIQMSEDLQDSLAFLKKWAVWPAEFAKRP